MIYVSQYLDPSRVLFLEEKDKKKALNTLIECVGASPHITDLKKFGKAVFEREQIMSTGIGLGIAIPHVKIKEVRDITIGIGVSKQGIPWDALDNNPVHIIFMIAGSSEQHQLYLRILSKIILVLKKNERREEILNANNAQDILNIFKNL